MPPSERSKRNRTFKSAARTSSVSHLPEALTGCTSRFGISDSDWEAALSGQEWRNGPAVKQLALPTMRAVEEGGSVAPAAGENKLEIENLRTVAGLRVPDIKPLIGTVVLRYLRSAERLAPGEVRDRRKTMPVVHLQRQERRVVVGVTLAGGRIDRRRLRAEHRAAEQPGTKSTVRT